MEEKELKYCNQCPNHCPETELKCGRGKEFFSQMQEGNAEAGKELYHMETPHGHRAHHRHGGRPFHKHDAGWDHEPADFQRKREDYPKK